MKNATPFRDVPYMGVIYVIAEAMKLGYDGGHPDWCNLGQGMPEIGPLPDAPERISNITIDPDDHAYGPVAGVPDLRQAVADLYNYQFRQDKQSQYTADNVAITAGGRLALTRIVWALNDSRIGYFTPDYTAYEDLLGGIERITPVHIPLSAEDAFKITPALLREQIQSNDVNVFLLSNPSNPTGQVISGKDLSEAVQIAREKQVSFLMDEFYSHYVWNQSGPVSAAKYIDDVDSDPVLIVDGLTKNFRYPGWRVGWTLGPKDWIETLTCSGSAVDGGPPRWLQQTAVKLVQTEHALQETSAMRQAFKPKRDLMASSLKEIGITLPADPDGTFYCWGSVADLPEGLNNGTSFFREALKHKVITVPGEYFDVNPNKKRPAPSPLGSYVRFSFGAPIDVVATGLKRLKKMISSQ